MKGVFNLSFIILPSLQKLSIYIQDNKDKRTALSKHMQIFA